MTDIDYNRHIVETHFRQTVEQFTASLGDISGYLCRVVHYSQAMSVLQLHVYPSTFEKRFELYFDSVEYFEGPLRWKGANFTVAPYEEALKLLEYVAKCGDFPMQDFLGHGCLYKCGYDDDIFKVLAWNITIKEVMTPER